MPSTLLPAAKPARRLILPVVLLALVASLLAAPASVAGTASLTLLPGRTAWATVGAKRTSVVASVTLVVPSALPVEVGLQLRAPSHSSGYRATLLIGADGTVRGSFSRLNSGAESDLLPATDLGVRVAPGDALSLQASVVATSRVWMYLRAWTSSVGKPDTWQLAASDGSRQRHTRAGRTYLYAEGTGSTRLPYGSAKAARYSAAKAARLGVVPPEPSPDTFGIAVLPDTQAETNITSNEPFLNRVKWIVAHREAFDLRYVLHTGDMTNWGWLDPGQLSRAKAAMTVIRDAGIPYSLSVGNHDTAAVGWNGIRGSTGYGGSAYMYNPECPTRLTAAACSSRLLVRRTDAFNAAFPLSSIRGVGGAYEAGRIDNHWTTFSAGGATWLVLTLELWPRTAVVDWAARVVAGHPDANVILQTHNYLSGDGHIGTTNGGYGATSPRYLYDRLVSKYPNVKLVFSGHTGGFTMRTDARGGNPVLAYLGNDLGGPTHNPVRVLSVNARTGEVFSRVYDPIQGRLVQATSSVITVIR